MLVSINRLINQLKNFNSVKDNAAPDKNPGSGHNTLLLRSIPDLFSVYPYTRQFHTLPGLLYSQASLQNFYPNASVPSM